MSGANSFKFVLLPPQSDTTRDWAKRLAEMVPEARVIVAEDADTACVEAIELADRVSPLVDGAHASNSSR